MGSFDAVRSFLAVMVVTATSVVAKTANYDAVAAAPSSYHVLMDDDTIRVLRVEVAPGATEPIHDHRWLSVMYFEQPQPITYITYKLVNGGPVETKRIDAPALTPEWLISNHGPDALDVVTDMINHAIANRRNDEALELDRTRRRVLRRLGRPVNSG